MAFPFDVLSWLVRARYKLTPPAATDGETIELQATVNGALKVSSEAPAPGGYARTLEDTDALVKGTPGELMPRREPNRAKPRGNVTLMWLLTLIDGALALALGLWQWTLLRARSGAIPCTSGVVSRTVIAVGVAALVGLVVVNVLVLRALGGLGPGQDAFAFMLWLGAMSACSILFIVSLTTLQVNREARVWINIVEPDALIVRESGAETRIPLVPGSVQAFIVGNGLSGPAFVQYHIAHGERRMNLVIPFTLAAAQATEGSPWLASYTGPVTQAGARRMNRFLVPFCAKHPGTEA